MMNSSMIERLGETVPGLQSTDRSIGKILLDAGKHGEERRIDVELARAVQHLDLLLGDLSSLAPRMFTLVTVVTLATSWIGAACAPPANVTSAAASAAREGFTVRKMDILCPLSG